jgi:hypothetical protein
VIVFGGGLALYKDNDVVGGRGISGDSACADHNVAWRIRKALGLDNLPAGPNPERKDAIIYDMNAAGQSASGFGHPKCDLSLAENGNRPATPAQHNDLLPEHQDLSSQRRPRSKQIEEETEDQFDETQHPGQRDPILCATPTGFNLRQRTDYLRGDLKGPARASAEPARTNIRSSTSCIALIDANERRLEAISAKGDPLVLE